MSSCNCIGPTGACPCILNSKKTFKIKTVPQGLKMANEAMKFMDDWVHALINKNQELESLLCEFGENWDYYLSHHNDFGPSEKFLAWWENYKKNTIFYG